MAAGIASPAVHDGRRGAARVRGIAVSTRTTKSESALLGNVLQEGF